METREAFSARIAALRSEKGLTQGALAEALGISRQSVTQYENSVRVPDIEVLAKFAEYFGVTSDYLLGLSDNRTNETAAIGDKLGLSDETIATLSQYVQRRDATSKNKGYYQMCLETINTIINEHGLVKALKMYIFHELNEYVSLSEWHTNMLNNGGEADYEKFCEAAQAINMYNVQCKLLDLSIRFSIRARKLEENNAEED